MDGGNEAEIRESPRGSVTQRSVLIQGDGPMTLEQLRVFVKTATEIGIPGDAVVLARVTMGGKLKSVEARSQ